MALPQTQLAAFSYQYTSHLGLADSFVTVSGDNRLKVWDTLTGKLRFNLAEPNHLAAQYCCVAYGRIGGNQIGDAWDIVAIGSKSGAIVLWNLRTGQLVKTLGGSTAGEAHNVRITDAVFSSDGSKLYTSAVDKKIICWDIASGAVLSSLRSGGHAATRLALSPDGTMLLCASSTIKLFDLAIKKIIHKYTGHATPVTALAFSPDGKYFISGASDRFVSIWDASATGNPKQPLCSLTLDAAPMQLLFHPSIIPVDETNGKTQEDADDEETDQDTEQKTKTSKNLYYVLGVSEGSTAHIWSFDRKASDSLKSSTENASDSTPATVVAPELCKVTVVIPKAGSEQRKYAHVTADEGALLRAVFVPRAGIDAASADSIAATDLLVARGSALRPVFERLSYVSETGDLQHHIRLALISKRVLNDETAGANRKRKSLANVTGNRSDLIVLGATDAPLPMESVKSANVPAVGAPPLKQAKVTEDTETKSSDAPAIPKANSLQTVLSQALHSADDSLIEYCLNSRSIELIRNTVDRLPAPDVLPLLQRVVEKFQTKPSRGVTLIPWIEEVLTHHTAYLLSVPNLGQHLAGLYQTIDTRLAVFKKLLKLSGRLELMLSQINVRNTGLDADSGVVGSAPLSVVQENDEDVITVEELRAENNIKPSRAQAAASPRSPKSPKTKSPKMMPSSPKKLDLTQQEAALPRSPKVTPKKSNGRKSKTPRSGKNPTAATPEATAMETDETVKDAEAHHSEGEESGVNELTNSDKKPRRRRRKSKTARSSSMTGTEQTATGADEDPDE